MTPTPTRPWWRRRRYVLGAIPVTCFLILILLFAINGLLLANNETPIGNYESGAVSTEPVPSPQTIKILSYNIAKGFAHRGDLSFASVVSVERRMRQIADLINAEQPDLVFLSEAIYECHPCSVNQVDFLVANTELKYWAFGENFNFGLPFWRVVGGNAILSRWPVEPIGNPSLAGRQPFYVTRNNRRVLWCELAFADETLLLASVHNDSFDIDNNLKQAQQLLDYCGDRPTIMAGDFNARPDDAPMQRIRNSGLFSGEWNGPLTFPMSAPDQTIDFVLAPADWQLIDHRTVPCDASDHLPVVSTFRPLFRK